MEETLRMGFAQVDITPEGPVETVGFGRPDEWSRGVLSHLVAQVTVWRKGGERCLLAAIDHIGFSKEHAALLRDELGRLLGVEREKVMLCFSHTHSAPNDSVSPEWFDSVRRKLHSAAETATEAMVPVRASWSNAVTDAGLNRRAESSELDRRVGILKVTDAVSGELKLIFLRLSVHCNVLKADNYLISADLFGAVRQAVEREYACPVMVSQGASGNIAPRYYKCSFTPPDAPDGRFTESGSALEDMAALVLRDVSPVIAAMTTREVARLSMYSREITLFADVPSEERAKEVAAEAKTYCGIDGTPWLDEVRRLNARGVKEQRDPTEVQYFALGEGCLAGVANEVMCEFALGASKILGDEYLYFGGYTNGCTGYFPTEEEFDKGGYEVYWSWLIYYMYHGHVYPLRRESASRLIAFAAGNAPEKT